MTYGAHIWTLNITALAWNNWKPRFNLWYHSSWSWTNRQFWAITVFFLYDKYSSVDMRENNIGGAGLVSIHCLFLTLAPTLGNPVGMASLQWRPVARLWPRQHLVSAKEYKKGPTWEPSGAGCLGGRGRTESKTVAAMATLLSVLYSVCLSSLFISVLFYFPGLVSNCSVKYGSAGGKEEERLEADSSKSPPNAPRRCTWFQETRTTPFSSYFG